MANLKALILAAGKGTRLRTEGSDLPKVMRQALGKPLLYYVLESLSFIPIEDIIIVAGYKKEKVMEYFNKYAFVEQREQLGTGHAVMSAKNALASYTGAVLVCCGDMPLIRRDTYEALVNTHFEERNTCTILSGTTDLQLPYGRIIRDDCGAFVKMVEENDCTEVQKNVSELSSGVYVFDTTALLPVLDELKNDNFQEEYYLTDVPAMLRGKGGKVGICKRDLGDEIIGVNTAEQLMQVEEILKGR